MSPNSPCFYIPIVILSISVFVVWLDAIRIYSKIKPDFSLFRDQLFIFKKVDPNIPFGAEFNKRRLVVLIIIGLSVIHNIIFALV